jgi:glyoxylate/hydroxypyruvate reductase A
MSDLIVVKSDFDRFHEWQTEFDKYAIEAIPWEQRHSRRSEIRYALVWQPEPGSLAALPSLEVIFSVGAGIDHLKGNNMVPDNIPVVRMVEDSLTAGMVEYVVYNVLRFHREMDFYEDNQRKHVWDQRMQSAAWDRTVGILGLGVLGTAAGQLLRQLQFNVIGWSRTEKKVAGIKSYFSSDQLPEFLSKCEFLVCLLPLTNATEGMVNRRLLKLLPKGAFFINAGRGPVMNERDLISALDSGQLEGAALDVFNQEPLPPDSPFWSHEKVVITPHVASITLPGTSAKHVAENILMHREGKPLQHLADLSRGY